MDYEASNGMIIPNNITLGLFDYNYCLEVPEFTGYKRQSVIFKIITDGDMVLENKFDIKFPTILSGAGIIDSAIIFIDNEPYRFVILSSSLHYSSGITLTFAKGALQLDSLIKDNFNEWHMKQVMI